MFLRKVLRQIPARVEVVGLPGGCRLVWTPEDGPGVLCPEVELRPRQCGPHQGREKAKTGPWEI